MGHQRVGVFFRLAITLFATWDYSQYAMEQCQCKVAIDAGVRTHFADYQAKAATLSNE